MLDIQTAERKPLRLEYFGQKLKADPAGRRQWPAEVSRKLAEESFRSQLSVERFAEEWQVSASLLSKWRMALRRPKEVPKQPEASDSKLLFAPVEIDDTPTPRTSAVAYQIPASIRIEHDGTVIQLPVTADVQLIEAAVRCLRAPQ